jgi:hypothetical protein
MGAPIIEVGQVVMSDAAACRKCNSPPEHASYLIKSGNYLRFVRKVVKAASDYGVPSIIVGPRHPFEVGFLMKSLRNPDACNGASSRAATNYDDIVSISGYSHYFMRIFLLELMSYNHSPSNNSGPNISGNKSAYSFNKNIPGTCL